MATPQALFSSVPDQDYLSAFPNKYKAAVDFLELQQRDVAQAAQIPVKSVRYDERIPADLARRTREWKVLINLVAEHFKGDLEKTHLWFCTPNFLLGNSAPRDFIRFGRYKKLYRFIQKALNEGHAP